MKKAFLSLLIALMTLSAQAQFLTGGTFNFWSGGDGYANTPEYSFKINPVIGYILNDDYSVGFCFNYETKEDVIKHAFSIAPFFRYNVLRTKCGLNLFLELDGKVGFYKADQEETKNQTLYSFGIMPGVSYCFDSHWSVEAYIGFIGYRHYDRDKGWDGGDESFGYNNGFGLDCSGDALSIGVYYAF